MPSDCYLELSSGAPDAKRKVTRLLAIKLMEDVAGKQGPNGMMRLEAIPNPVFNQVTQFVSTKAQLCDATLGGK